MFTVDVGNTSIGVFDHDSPVAELLRFRSPREAAEVLRGAVEVVAISVSTPRVEELRALLPLSGRGALRRLSGVPIPLVDERLARSAGQDRLALALAALPGPAVVVDAGTAVTVEIVDAAGRYAGGFIAPGGAVALDGLTRATDALPARSFERASLRPGHDTDEAMSAGAWGLMVGGVDRLVEAGLASLGGSATEAQLIATGGWAEPWSVDSRYTTRVAVDPVLIHRGLRLWATRG